MNRAYAFLTLMCFMRGISLKNTSIFVAQTNSLCYKSTQTNSLCYKSTQTNSLCYKSTQTNSLCYKRAQTNSLCYKRAQTNSLCYKRARVRFATELDLSQPRSVCFVRWKPYFTKVSAEGFRGRSDAVRNRIYRAWGSGRLFF